MQYASPATVSRCGMVYVDPKNLGYSPYWDRWVNSLPGPEDCEEFNKLFDKYVPKSISLILDGIMDGKQGDKLKTIVPQSNLNLVSFNFLYCMCISCGSRGFVGFVRTSLSSEATPHSQLVAPC